MWGRKFINKYKIRPCRKWTLKKLHNSIQAVKNILFMFIKQLWNHRRWFEWMISVHYRLMTETNKQNKKKILFFGRHTLRIFSFLHKLTRLVDAMKLKTFFFLKKCNCKKKNISFLFFSNGCLVETKGLDLLQFVVYGI